MSMAAFHETILFTGMGAGKAMNDAKGREEGGEIAKFASPVSLNRF